MEKDFEKEYRYEKVKRMTVVFGCATGWQILVTLIYLVIAIKLYSISYLYLAIGVPVLSVIAIVFIAILILLVKKDNSLKSEIYDKRNLSATNFLFRQFIGEYCDNGLVDLAHGLPFGWRVANIDNCINSIVFDIEHRRSGFHVDVTVSNDKVEFRWEERNSEEARLIVENLDSEKFTDYYSVTKYIVGTCVKLKK